MARFLLVPLFLSFFTFSGPMVFRPYIYDSQDGNFQAESIDPQIGTREYSDAMHAALTQIINVLGSRQTTALYYADDAFGHKHGCIMTVFDPRDGELYVAYSSLTELAKKEFLLLFHPPNVLNDENALHGYYRNH